MIKKKQNEILFFTKLFYPHVGGVEKQVMELSIRLIKLGYKITIVTEKYSDRLKNEEENNGIKIIRFLPLKLKFIGLIYIWLWLLKNRKFIEEADVVHAHSVYVWYWPFRFLYPSKPSFVTFHGWEGIYPIPLRNIIIRKIDAFLADKNIAISDYLEKHYKIKADRLMYTSVDLPKIGVNPRKNPTSILYVGRLDLDTGLTKILEAFSLLKNMKLSIGFCGDGPLRHECEKYGKVYGFVDPKPYYRRSAICVSPGVTSVLEAFTYKCLIITTYNNPVKKDYLLMTPFKNWIIVEKTAGGLAEKIRFYVNNYNKAAPYIDHSYNWVKTQNWNNAVKTYLNLWHLN